MRTAEDVVVGHMREEEETYLASLEAVHAFLGVRSPSRVALGTLAGVEGHRGLGERDQYDSDHLMGLA